MYETSPKLNFLVKVLHLHAVEKAFEHLMPPILKDESTLEKWMRDVQQTQNALVSLLLLPTTPVSFSRCSEHYFKSFECNVIFDLKITGNMQVYN